MMQSTGLRKAQLSRRSSAPSACRRLALRAESAPANSQRNGAATESMTSRRATPRDSSTGTFRLTQSSRVSWKPRGWPSPPAPGDPLLSLTASRPRRGSQALSFSGPSPGPTCPHQSRWYCPAPPVKGGGRHQAGIWVCPARRVISMGCDLWASPTPPQGPCALSSSGLAGAPSGLSLGATSPCPPGLSASVPMGPAQCFLALG